MELHDPVGPAGTDPSLTAIVVSPETAGGVEKVNAARKQRGLGLLRGIEIGYVMGCVVFVNFVCGCSPL